MRKARRGNTNPEQEMSETPRSKRLLGRSGTEDCPGFSEQVGARPSPESDPLGWRRRMPTFTPLGLFRFLSCFSLISRQDFSFGREAYAALKRILPDKKRVFPDKKRILSDKKRVFPERERIFPDVRRPSCRREPACRCYSLSAHRPSGLSALAPADHKQAIGPRGNSRLTDSTWAGSRRLLTIPRNRIVWSGEDHGPRRSEGRRVVAFSTLPRGKRFRATARPTNIQGNLSKPSWAGRGLNDRSEQNHDPGWIRVVRRRSPSR